MLGSKSIGFVLDSKRLSSAEAVELGLLDRVVPDDQLLGVATDLAAEWGKGGKSTTQHLRLLRPPKDLVEAAMQREVVEARSAWEDGVTSAGVRAFLGRERPSGEATEPAGRA